VEVLPDSQEIQAPDPNPTRLLAATATGAARDSLNVGGLSEADAMFLAFPKPAAWNQDLREMCRVRTQSLPAILERLEQNPNPTAASPGESQLDIMNGQYAWAQIHAYIGEIVMIGNQRHFPAALVIPKFEALEKWARDQGLPFASREELVERPEVIALYDRTVRELTAHLAPFEKIKKLALLPREFTLETGELTPKLSVKRRVVEQKYKHVIDRLYEGGAAA